MKIKSNQKSKKMNPLIVILVFAVLAVILAKNGIEKTKSYEYSIEKIYQENSTSVDSGTTALMNHDGFNRLDSENKVTEMGKLLKTYEQAGVITNLYYSEDNKMYTYIYNTGDISGALGGVSLREKDPYMN